MPDYSFYITEYMGDSIPEDQFNRLVKRANDQLARYKRMYTVTAPEETSEGCAVCAMADALYYFECAQSGDAAVSSASIGSVSVSYGASNADLSPRAQEAEIFRCACLYLDIYRGCG